MSRLIHRIVKRLDWEWHKLYDAIYRICVKAPNVMTYEECVEYIIANRASVSRMGDGELGVIYGRSLGFQSKDERLGERLREVMARESRSLLICIPDTFENLGRYNVVEQNFWRSHHYYNRRRWHSLLKPCKRYGDTFLSRFYSMEYDHDLSCHRIRLLKRLWDKRDVVFIEGKDTKMGIGNDLFDNAASIRRILCPSRDAYARYDSIVNSVKAMGHSKNDLYILALGPTATVMAADLHVLGFQALDLGHLDIEYEWFRQGVTKKVPITGKFSNEAAILGLADNAMSGEIKSEAYTRQIVVDLSE